MRICCCAWSFNPESPMSVSVTSSVPVRGVARWLVPLCIGAGVYLFFLGVGDIMLRDSDTLWQIKIGQWILEHRALPTTDIYSFTRAGEPWISSSWLSQVLFALVYEPSNWSGVVILTSLAIGATAAIFVHLLEPYLEPARAFLLVTPLLFMSMGHFLARPHMLALPVMVAFVGGLLAAADRRTAPSWLLLPLMALWANLHGGFVMGLALIGAIGLDALASADRKDRFALAARWAVFGLAALAAACCTPYGWNTLLASTKILSLGKLLSMIWEWMPADFSSLDLFGASLLGLIAIGYYSGLVLSWTRILLLLGLVWAALNHVRNIEAFALLTPLVLAKPFAEQLGVTRAVALRAADARSSFAVSAIAALAIVAAGWSITRSYATPYRYAFIGNQSPAAAVDVLERRHAQRIFSTAPIGGYLITRNIKTFIDGRAELYGEQFVLDYFDAVEGKNVETLLRLLDTYRIDATLLNPTVPASRIMDHLPGWKRLYADDVAVVHVRDDTPLPSPSR
ncbi:blr7140 [Bradyrhizobium diazoefficiens USDA 110]|uniref:Blr7140 protein n=2 Tax=Bradyrhizobium diazoefficiens TaxID=1355477 RepID=Q89EE5_BRADU|nr:hypothetical protein CO678_20620 [Bradyrhizobium diazoefficiens]QBP25884.1 hypothetical protein Bdiaspc4_37665 [Bradyrhizobium diazoefficiens]BAC52405.1 blr7140 [Bradyrhizobium diazoefficiens USDA 110]